VNLSRHTKSVNASLSCGQVHIDLADKCTSILRTSAHRCCGQVHIDLADKCTSMLVPMLQVIRDPPPFASNNSHLPWTQRSDHNSIRTQSLVASSHTLHGEIWALPTHDEKGCGSLMNHLPTTVVVTRHGFLSHWCAHRSAVDRDLHFRSPTAYAAFVFSSGLCCRKHKCEALAWHLRDRMVTCLSRRAP